ncbi:AraC family transcriptional regulator [Paenibacillus whitsoniae]|uniref:AraC family transcriptional regulator n=1 Tax=Paenibacillus whitsoniae TaxID=2496558 RepID=A0A430JIK6_9BACL|nr:AraC family transcriptional regulator [Paenibacillus whitsoniae]RTE10859.1 AraC family transcriptional regulator [Paenibacillus whitsoniae]
MHLRKIDTVNLTEALGEESGGGIHPYHEILFISEGVAALKWMGQDYLAPAPALFLLPPNTPHLLVKQSPACKIGYIELDMRCSADFLDLSHAALWNRMQSDKDPQLPELASIYESACRMWDSLSPQSPYKAIAEDLIMLDIRKLLLMIAYFLRARESQSIYISDSFQIKSDTNERIQTIIRYMESNYYKQITVNLLASHAHLEVSYFIRAFHKIVGKTPLQYLHDLRLNAAASFLQTTKMSVQHITEAVGFQSIHYFSRLFKQRFGVSPSLWRSRHTL